MISLDANFSRTQLFTANLPTDLWLFELRGGFRNFDIIIWRLIEILTSQGLVVTRNCELIIVLNLLKVLEHLIIIRS